MTKSIYISLLISLCALQACGGSSSSSSSFSGDTSGDTSSGGSSSSSCQADQDSATFSLESGPTTRLVMNGTIDCTTEEKLFSALGSDPIDTIVMSTVEGSVDDEANIRMSRRLSGQQINIVVADDGLIASGGVDFFLAGATRRIGNNSVVAVHSWADENNTQGIDLYNQDPTNSQHLLYINYYTQYVSGLRDGIPGNSITDANRDFYVYTLQAAPASGLHCMTSQELVAWGIVTNTANASDLNPTVMGSTNPLAEACTH